LLRSKQEADDDVDIRSKQEADDDVDIKKQARSR
jgi:hypothetical protein